MTDHPLFKAAHILEKVGIPYCLMASTLLGIYRGNEPIGGTYEFCAYADDFTLEKIEEVRKFHEQVNLRGNPEVKQIVDLGGLYTNNFEIHLIHFNDKYAYHNLVEDFALVWPKEILLKENWRVKEWKGKMWCIPGDPEKYLELYYGNWREPQPFNWHSAKNLYKMGQLQRDEIKMEDGMFVK